MKSEKDIIQMRDAFDFLLDGATPEQAREGAMIADVLRWVLGEPPKYAVDQEIFMKTQIAAQKLRLAIAANNN